MFILPVLLSVLTPHPAVSWKALKAPPFPAHRCASYRMGPEPSGAAVIGDIEQNGASVSLGGAVLNFVIDGLNAPGHGYLYYQLDDEPGQYIATSDVSQTRTFGIWFHALDEGLHAIRFGLIADTTSNISYAQICFSVKRREMHIFDEPIQRRSVRR